MLLDYELTYLVGLSFFMIPTTASHVNLLSNHGSHNFHMVDAFSI